MAAENENGARLLTMLMCVRDLLNEMKDKNQKIPILVRDAAKVSTQLLGILDKVYNIWNGVSGNSKISEEEDLQMIIHQNIFDFIVSLKVKFSLSDAQVKKLSDIFFDEIYGESTEN